MARILITFCDRNERVFEGSEEAVSALTERMREAMAGGVDRVISHDLVGEPKDFLCSDIVHFHAERS